MVTFSVTLKDPLTQFSRSWHFWTLNISKTYRRS